jgi:hypothetical protein
VAVLLIPGYTCIRSASNTSATAYVRACDFVFLIVIVYLGDAVTFAQDTMRMRLEELFNAYTLPLVSDAEHQT